VNSGAGERITKHIPDPNSENRLRHCEYNEAPESQPKSDGQFHREPLRSADTAPAKLRRTSTATILDLESPKAHTS
jgi:hypothetical protein